MHEVLRKGQSSKVLVVDSDSSSSNKEIGKDMGDPEREWGASVGPRRPCASQAYSMNKSRRNEWFNDGPYAGFPRDATLQRKVEFV